MKPLAEDDPKRTNVEKAIEKAVSERDKAKQEVTTAERNLAGLESNVERSKKQAEVLAGKVEETKSKQAEFEAKVAALKTERENLQKKLSDEVPKLEVGGVTFSHDGSQVYHSPQGWNSSLLQRRGWRLSRNDLYPSGHSRSLR